MKLGARIVKTGAAVALALGVCEWLGFEDAAFAAIAATLMIQPSLYRSWKHFLEQLQANLIGVTIAVGGVLLLGHHPLVVGLLVIAVITINLRLKYDRSIGLSVFAAIAVTEGAAVTGAYLPFALHRFELILIGIFSATLLNVLFIPPKYEGQLLHEIKETRDQMSLLMRNMITQEIRAFPEEKEKVLERLKSTEEYFERYREEQTYMRRDKHQAARRLVLFKRMIHLLYKEMETIRTLDRHLPFLNVACGQGMRDRLQVHISTLTAYHQKILGKYEGTIKSQYPHEKSAKVFAGHERLLRDLIELYDPRTEQTLWVHVLPVVAVLSDLALQMDHLDKLIDVYSTYHKTN